MMKTKITSQKSFLLLCSLLLCSFLTAQTGNVGIGTEMPEAKLHVEGDLKAKSRLEVLSQDGLPIFSVFEDNEGLKKKMTGTMSMYGVNCLQDEIMYGRHLNSGLLKYDVLNPDGHMKSLSFDNVEASEFTDFKNFTQTTQASVDGNQVYKKTLDINNGQSSEEFMGDNGALSWFEKKAGMGYSYKKQNTVGYLTDVGIQTMNSSTNKQAFFDCDGISIIKESNFIGFSFNINDEKILVSGSLCSDIIESSSGLNLIMDHPLDPENKQVVHSSVQSDQTLNIYRGNVTTDENGFATVELPDYFSALNQDVSYHLTAIGKFTKVIVSSEIENSHFVIQSESPNTKISWQVIGERTETHNQAFSDVRNKTMETQDTTSLSPSRNAKIRHEAMATNQVNMNHVATDKSKK